MNYLSIYSTNIRIGQLEFKFHICVCCLQTQKVCLPTNPRQSETFWHKNMEDSYVLGIIIHLFKAYRTANVIYTKRKHFQILKRKQIQSE